jgi:hypothetical protein
MKVECNWLEFGMSVVTDYFVLYDFGDLIVIYQFYLLLV